MSNNETTYRFGEFSLDFSPLVLSKNGESLALTPKSLGILLLLIKNRGKIIAKEKILSEVWQNSFVSDSVIAVNINSIRKVIGKEFISSKKKLGYIFNGNIEVNTFKKFETDSSLEVGFDKFIGRQKELRLLQLSFRNCSKNKGTALFIGGEAGTGKTTLIQQFLKTVEDKPDTLVLTASFFDFIGTAGHSLLHYFKLLQAAFVKLDWMTENYTCDEAILVAVIREKLAVDFSLELLNRFITNSLDEYMLNLISFKLTECFLSLSEKTQTVIGFDDVHLADEFSLGLVGNLAVATRSKGLIIMFSARSDAETLKITRFKNWLEIHTKQNSFTKIELNNFDAEECRRYIAELFVEKPAGKLFSESDAAEIYRITNGNPFFLREYFSRLIADGKIVKHNGLWLLAGISNVTLSPILASYTGSQLKSLSEKDRFILEAACIVGEEFKVATVEKVTGLSLFEIKNSLESSLQKGILIKQTVNSGTDFQFRHNILYRLFYESILPTVLFGLHEKTAQVFEEIYADNPEQAAGILAEHYYASQNYRKSLKLSISAADEARKINDQAHLSKYLVIAEKSAEKTHPADFATEDKCRFLFCKGYQFERSTRLGKALPVLAEALDLAEKIENQKLIADICYEISAIDLMTGNLESGSKYLEKSESIYRKIGEKNGEYLAKTHRAVIFNIIGQYKKGIEAIEKFYFNQEFETLDNHIKIQISQILADGYAMSGYAEKGKHILLESIDNFGEFSANYGLISARKVLANIHIMLGEYRAAENLLDSLSVSSETTETGLAVSGFLTGMKLKILYNSGLFSEALQIIDDNADFFASLKSVNSIMITSHVITDISIDVGRFAEAEIEIGKLKKLCEKVSDADISSLAEHLNAKYLNRIGQFDEAAKCAERSLKSAKKSETLVNESLALIELAWSIKHFMPNEAVNFARQAVSILETIKSGACWRAYWNLAQIQLFVPNKLVDNNEIIANLTKTVDLLDGIRRQSTAENSGNINRFNESAKNHSQPAIRLAALLKNSNEPEKLNALVESWNLAEFV